MIDTLPLAVISAVKRLACSVVMAITAGESLPVVDVCEINKTPHLRQVILYRWMWLPNGRSHYVSQWWKIEGEPEEGGPLIERRGNRWLVSSEGRRFYARTLRRTETNHDPEYKDRDNLIEEDRRPYLCLPH